MANGRLALLFRCDSCNSLEQKLEGNYLAVSQSPPGESLQTVFYCMSCAFRKYGDKTRIKARGREILDNND